jgi:translocation and assembly module TamA
MTLPSPRRGGRARWPLWLCASLWPLLTVAQTPDAVPPAGTGQAPQARPAGPRFDLVIDTPQAPLRDFLQRHLELMRYRELADLEAPELQRLLARAQDNLLDLLGTQGHFSPQVRIEGPQPGGDTPLGTVRIAVDPGPLTLVASADVYFRGDIADNPQAQEQREAVRRAFAIRPGQPFTQDAWNQAKGAALRALTAQRYPAGRLYNSLADVDTTDHSVRLGVELDSGTPLRLGELRVEGAERYDSAEVERLARLSGLTPGSDYDLVRLQDARQRIADTGHYESVHVSVDPGVDQASAPVLIQLREALRQKLVLGVGGSTDSGARLSIEHTHFRVPGIGWQATSKLQLERDDRQLSTDWSSPVDDKGWKWVTSALAARQIDGNDTTTSQRIRLGQAQSSKVKDRSAFLQYDRARSVNSLVRSLGTDGAEASLTANYTWTWRYFDSTPFPQRGYGFGWELGAGYTLAGERRPFGRTTARWLGYWPLGGSIMEMLRRPPAQDSTVSSEPVTGPWGRLVLRAEGGAVWAKRDTPVPETQLFLTGGDATVRGYGLRDIGVPQADGGVSPGRYMTTGSVEWQIPIRRNGQRTAWEAALFVDGGSVAESIPDLKARYGVGGGVRYNSPVGPLRLDIAYGVQPRKRRLHFNVGFSF